MNISRTPKNNLYQNYSQNHEKIDKSNIYDDEFVSLINGLNESIKEYYKVSRHNIVENNNFISFYGQQGQSIEILLNEIINTNQFEKINEFIEKINKLNEITNQLQINSDSNKKNLDLFFEDAKILFKKMKIKRKQKLTEMNNSMNNNMNNNNNNQNMRNSYGINSNNSAKKVNKINLTTVKNNPEVNPLIAIQKVYSQIIILVNKLANYNNLLDGFNIAMSGNYISLQNNIKKELDKLMRMIKTCLAEKSVNSKNMNNITANITDRKRSNSQSNSLNKEIEKLKLMNNMNEQKIKDLTNQLIIYQNSLNEMGKSSDLDSKKYIQQNNNLNIKIMKLEKLIKEKDNIIINLKNGKQLLNNNNTIFNLNNILKQKNSKILELEQELNIYQKNENLLNTQIKDLNNKFQMKMNQYENEIALMKNNNISLNKNFLNKNNEILNLQNEKDETNVKFNNLNSKNISNNKNENDITENQYEEVIRGLKNDIEIYQKRINQYENQINELSNKEKNYNNLNNNNINNNSFALQKEIEKLNKQIEILVNKNSIYEQRLNNMNIKYNNTYKLLEDQKVTINQLNKEIINYKKKEKLNEETNNNYIKQIEDMNNNILSTNKIIEQKDELIKQLNERKAFQNYSNNELYQIKNENENEEMQLKQDNYNNINNNNLSKGNIIIGQDIKQLQELNNKIIEENNLIKKQNKELLEKINQFTLNNTSQKESLSKLEKDIIKKNDELEGLKTFIFKLQNQLEIKDNNLEVLQKNNEMLKMKAEKDIGADLFNKSNDYIKKKNSNLDSKSLDTSKDANSITIKKLSNQLNEAQKKITTLQNRNRELLFKLEEKEVQKEISGFRTEDNNFSNYEEEFDLKKMVSGARDKNRSEDINIDYPGVQSIKDKYKELLQNKNMLEEQIKILIYNINCNNKIKPTIRQICQLMRISSKNIELIIAGKDKKRALGLID